MVRAAVVVRSRLTRPGFEVVLLAVVAYLPFLLSAPGQVSADSKQALLLDPARFLAGAPYLWDSGFAAGTVTHQNIGFLWPIGPFFWLGDALGLPVWVTQRLWMGSLTFAAILGARWLLRSLGIGRAGALVGALLYAFSPYQLAYVSRMSVLLLPWAGLPWIIELTRRAARRGGWRHPALAALVVGSVSTINASAVLLVAPGPLLALAAHAARGRRPAREALGAGIRIAVLVVPLSAWWLAGLRVQGAYGLPVLQVTEHLSTVSAWSDPLDVLRGIGNWIFYGTDHLGYSIDQARSYVEDPWVLVASYAVPAMALTSAVVLRWRHRALAVALLLVGTVLAVGAWPYDDPSLYGRFFRAFGEDTTLGLALRNTPRAVPLLLVGGAMAVGAAITAIRAERPRRVLAVLAAIVVIAGAGPVWTTGYLTDRHSRPEEVPAHWREAIAQLDAADHETRILAVPGVNFAAHRWGHAVEPITPALTDRGFVAREVLPWGSAASATFLDALDRRIQLGILEPESVAPIARLFGVGDIVFRGDVDTDRFGLRGTDELWPTLLASPGLGEPATFGPAFGSETPDVAVLPVEHPLPIVRLAPRSGSVLLAGDADGMVDAAAAGLLDGRALVLLSGATDDARLDDALAAGADLVLTDTNRRRIQTWFYSIVDTRGPTEREGETLIEPSGYDARLDPLAAAGDDGRSVALQLGASADASASGGAERPESRAAAAVDGSVDTAWEIPAATAVGARWSVESDGPVALDGLVVTQLPSRDGGPRITSLRVAVGDDEPIAVELDASSRTPTGQSIPLTPTTAGRIEIEITGVDGPTADRRTDLVGLAEVASPIGTVDESVRLPVDLLARAGERSEQHGLDVVLTRLRRAPEAGRRDEEPSIDRTFSLPTARTFSLSGTARTPTIDGSNDLGRCRGDLLFVDGRPVDVRLDRRPDDAAVLDVELCAEAVHLAAGEHRITTEVGAGLRVDIDRLVLSSAPGGGPRDVGVRGRDAEDAPAVLTSVDSGRVDVTAEIETDGRAVWFVLGQSENDGWDIEVDGGSAGPRQLVDGYANGWLITPDGPGTVTVSVRWTPQRVVWAGLLVSALAAVACLVVIGGTQRAATRRAPVVPTDRPDLRAPFGTVVDGRARAGAATLSATLTGLSMAVVAGPLIGVGAAASAAVLALSRASWWLALVGISALLLGARVLERPTLAWGALALVLADVIARLVTRRWPGPPR